MINWESFWASSIVTGLVVALLLAIVQGVISWCNNKAISKLTHKLDQQNSSIKSHIDQFLSANQISHQIKIDAYKEAWDKLAEVKYVLPYFIRYLDAYKKGEYDNAKKDKIITGLLELSDLLKPESSFSKATGDFLLTLEKKKPYLDKAYIFFYSYSFFLIRLSYLAVINFQRQQKIAHWEDDVVLNRIIKHWGVLTEVEINSIISKEFFQIQHIQFLFEQKIFKYFDEICIGLSLPLKPEQNELVNEIAKGFSDIQADTNGFKP